MPRGYLRERMSGKRRMELYERIREILESARVTAARSVNTTQVVANWLIGREIVEEEQRGSNRAEYGQQLIYQLSECLKKDFGTGYSAQNLFYMRQFYQSYPLLSPASEIFHALRGKSAESESIPTEKLHALRRKSWQPGQLQLYVNYYNRERRTRGDNPTLGLILCTDKNDAVVRYTLGEEQQKRIFASRYKLHLPTEAELQAELRRELRLLKGELGGRT